MSDIPIRMDHEALDRFWYWMRERHEIYLKRRVGLPKPWTTDHILRDYRFCNVFRELDTVTWWIREHWREPYADHPNLWLAMTIARFVNWPPTLNVLGFPEQWDPEKFVRTIEDIVARGEKAYTGAYMVRGDIQGGYRTKSAYLAYKVIEPMVEYSASTRVVLQQRSLQKAVEYFNAFYGLSGFMSYEIVTDLRWGPLSDAEDIYTWANAGPGAVRGLNRLHGRKVRTGLSAGAAVKEMRDLLVMSEEAPLNSIKIDQRVLEMRDIEHSLCEFDKYERIRLGQGTVRARYAGAA